MKDNRFRLTFKGGASELEKLVQVCFEELLAAFEKITHLKVNLELHKHGYDLLVHLTLFQAFKVAQ